MLNSNGSYFFTYGGLVGCLLKPPTHKSEAAEGGRTISQPLTLSAVFSHS